MDATTSTLWLALHAGMAQTTLDYNTQHNDGWAALEAGRGAWSVMVMDFQALDFSTTAEGASQAKGVETYQIDYDAQALALWWTPFRLGAGPWGLTSGLGAVLVRDQVTFHTQTVESTRTGYEQAAGLRLEASYRVTDAVDLLGGFQYYAGWEIDGNGAYEQDPNPRVFSLGARWRF